MIEWPAVVVVDEALVLDELRALVDLQTAWALFRALPATGQVAAIAEFRRLRGRVPKPCTGPLVMPAVAAAD
jgi:hypothetical protein